MAYDVLIHKSRCCSREGAVEPTFVIKEGSLVPVRMHPATNSPFFSRTASVSFCLIINDNSPDRCGWWFQRGSTPTRCDDYLNYYWSKTSAIWIIAHISNIRRQNEFPMSSSRGTAPYIKHVTLHLLWIKLHYRWINGWLLLSIGFLFSNIRILARQNCANHCESSRQNYYGINLVVYVCVGGG